MRIITLFAICLLLSCNVEAQKKKTPAASLAAADSSFLAGNYSTSILLYEAAMKDAALATQAQPWFRLGQSYHATHNYQKAIVSYAKAEKINRRLPGLWVNMARTYSISGDLVHAKLKLDSALAAGFGNDKILAQHPDFENLRKSDSYKSIAERAYANSHPCTNSADAHAFDFWLGEWDVFSTANPAVKAGTNRITSQSGGCVILESWESSGPHNGVSINYFDPVKGKWQQKWAGSGQDILEFYDGEYKDGAMRFKWDGRNPNSSTFMGRLTFTNLPEGNVRQHSERSDDGGVTWTTVYDFTYVPMK